MHFGAGVLHFFNFLYHISCLLVRRTRVITIIKTLSVYVCVFLFIDSFIIMIMTIITQSSPLIGVRARSSLLTDGGQVLKSTLIVDNDSVHT